MGTRRGHPMPKQVSPEIGRHVIVHVPNRPVRLGIIVGEARNGQWWNIRLDGHGEKTQVSIHKSYVKFP